MQNLLIWAVGVFMGMAAIIIWQLVYEQIQGVDKIRSLMSEIDEMTKRLKVLNGEIWTGVYAIKPGGKEKKQS